MSAWLLSILGVTVIGVLTELLLTDNVMSNFIRSIYSFFILFVIVSPIPAFLRNAAVDVGGAVAGNTELVRAINENSAAAYVRNTENILTQAGFAGVIVTVDFDKTAPRFRIQKVYVNAWNSTNKNTAEIIKIVTAVCGVSADSVEVYTG